MATPIDSIHITSTIKDMEVIMEPFILTLEREGERKRFALRTLRASTQPSRDLLSVRERE